MDITARINSLTAALRRRDVVTYNAVLLGPEEHTEFLSIVNPRIEGSLRIYRVETPGITIATVHDTTKAGGPPKSSQPPVVAKQVSRTELLVARIKQMPASADVLEVARVLKLEGFYNPKTALVDIARRVTAIRCGKKYASLC